MVRRRGTGDGRETLAGLAADGRLDFIPAASFASLLRRSNLGCEGQRDLAAGMDRMGRITKEPPDPCGPAGLLDFIPAATYSPEASAPGLRRT